MMLHPSVLAVKYSDSLKRSLMEIKCGLHGSDYL